MRKTTNNIKRRNNYILLTIMTFMVSLMLVGCGSNATTETVKSEPEAVVKEEAPKVEEVVETKIPEEAAVEEPVVEETVVEEPEDALYIPEGIDMESTLSGEEWVASFVGNVAEPVVVIYNDNSGRKEVVQANKEVTINPDEDIIAVYWPKEGMRSTSHAISVITKNRTDNYDIYYELDAESMRDIPERPAMITVKGGAEDWVIEFTIIVE